MATRKSRGQEDSPRDKPDAESPGEASLRDSASQIWLAGLGAFAKAQEEGGRVFEALVREGTEIQRRTQAATEEKLSEAAQRITSMANDISSRASGQFSRLETLFEERVAQALKGLGMPTADQVQALVRRIEQLEEALAASQRAQGSAGRTAARKARAGTQAAASSAAAAPARPRRAAPRKKA